MHTNGLEHATSGTPASGSLQARRASSPTRSLAPREHGAYGQLAMPLVAALGMGRIGVGAAALSLASVAMFFGHEPALVALGHRGSRARREDGAPALARLCVLGAAASALGGIGLAFSPSSAHWALAVPAALVAVLALFIARGAEKTAIGELIAAAALSSASIPVALASGVGAGAAWSAWLAWCAAFGGSTFAVRSTIAHRRAALGWPRRLAAPLALAVLLIVAARSGYVAWLAPLAASPMIAVALVLAAVAPSPRYLKRVGWTLVAASVLSTAILVVGARAGA